MIPRHRVLFPHIGARPRVLVPVLMGQMARPAISVGDALATSPGGSGNVLGLVEIRTGRDNEIFAQEQRRRDMLRWVAGLEYPGDGHRRLSVSLRMAANLASSVRDFAAENETTSLVLEWPTVSSPRRHGLIDLSRQLLPDRGTDVVFDACGSALTLAHIQTDSQHPDRSRREWDTFEQIVDELHRPSAKVRVRHHESAAIGLLEEATGQDLVIIGSRLSPSKPEIPIGRELQRIVRRLDCPVLLVRPKHLSPTDSTHAVASNGYEV